jgi:xylulokinase
MSDLVISVDCSTSGVKCIAWGLDGSQVATGSSPLSLSIPQHGYGEQDPRDWWKGLLEAVRSCMQYLDPARIKAFAVTHQRETFACLDAGDSPIRPAMLWLDVRAGDQVNRFGTPRIHEVTGKPANPTPAFYKLLWIRENEPETLERTTHIVDVHGYIAHRLTGHWRTSVASADPLGLVDLATGDYSDEILDIVGITREQLPELVQPGEVLGELSKVAADALGLVPGIPVISGAGDGQSAGLGAGIVAPGTAYLNVGSGLIMGSFSSQYLPSTAYRTMAGTVPGTVNYELFVGAGTLMVSWFMKTFAENQEIPGGLGREAFWERQAQDIEAGAGGLFVLPYWNGQLTPYWDHNARGVMLGFAGAHTSAHVYRAMLEGVAFELRLCLEEAEPNWPAPITELIAMGGGTRSPLWCQIFADVLQRPITLAGSDEATALGAGILGAVGAGLHVDVIEAVQAMTSKGQRYEPIAENVDVYENLYRTYKQIYPALKPVFAEAAKHA